MSGLLKSYRYVNILSLDITAGAVVCALFFASIVNVHILPYGLAALALTVWIIYTADHLRDAVTIQKTASSERHRFHQQHFKLLAILLLLAIIIDIIIVLYARKPVFRWGICLGSIVIIYLVIQRYLKFLKEIFIAFLYTCGVLLPSVSVTAVELTSVHYLLFVQFGLIALMNLYLFSWFDYHTDQTDSQRSFATTVGRSRTKQTIVALGVIVFAVGIYLLWLKFFPGAAILLTLMGMLHLAILMTAHHENINKNYRAFADPIFLLPAIYLIWAS